MIVLGEFKKECPVCQKQFSNLIEYMTHLGNDHREISPDRLVKLDKEEKWKFSK